MTSLPERAEERQLGAAVAAALLLGGTTVLCRLPWTAVLPGGLLGTAYYYIMYRLGRRTPLPVQQAARLVCGNHIARFLSVLSAGVLALLAGWITGRSVAVFSDLRQAHWAGLGVLALAAVAAQRGTAVTLRCASVLLVPLAAAFAVVRLCAVQDLRASWLLPVPTARQIAAAAAVFLLPGAGAYLLPQLRRERQRALWRLPALAACGAGLTALLTAGVLSPAVAAQPFSFLTLCRSISLFGVMVRLEALISGAMTVCAFLACALLLCAARQSLRPRRRCGASRTETAALFGVGSVGIALCNEISTSEMLLFGSIFCGLIPLAIQGLVCAKKAVKKLIFSQKKC